ncbi:MAG: methyltransferase domain-containing protein [Acidobacteriota bacterium]
MTSARAESTGMRLARCLRMERVAWSLRRLHCPVDRDALVLEVGSGGNPYGRANVLLDAYFDTRERHWAPLTVDRPFVFGFLEKLPFKDKAFDFVIASHVLEHSPAPDRALAEMQRVAKAGYIEVPDAFMERVNPYKDHRAEITVRGGRLVIRKKPGWMVDPDLVELYESRAKPLFAGRLIPSHPFAFHVRHYWEGQVEFDVINPETDSSWPPPVDDRIRTTAAVRGGWRSGARRLLRGLMSQSSRNRTVDLPSLLACPTCSHSPLARRAGHFECEGCATDYPDRDGLPMLYPVVR